MFKIMILVKTNHSRRAENFFKKNSFEEQRKMQGNIIELYLNHEKDNKNNILGLHQKFLGKLHWPSFQSTISIKSE